MITIDTSLVYQTSYNQLNTRRTNQSAYASIDSYTDDYSTKNTTSTNNKANEEINTGDADLDAILKELKLTLPANRFSVLLHMKREDLINMLFLLEKDKLCMGLKFFKKDKLINYISNLSKDEILKVVGQLFSKQEILAMMPTKFMYGFLDKVKLDANEMAKLIKSLPLNVLAQVYESATGEAAGKMNHDDYIQKFGEINQGLIMEGFKALPSRELANVIDKMTDINPKLMKLFSATALCLPLEDAAKSKIIEGMMVLDQDKLIKLVGQLPNSILANIDTLIDPKVFSDYLMKNNKSFLQSLAA